jgi:prolyl-tRNA synthetase
MKGIPVRLAIGQRDLEKNEIEVARRDTREKFTANLDGIEETVAQLLLDIQENLFQRAKSFRSQKSSSKSKTRDINDTFILIRCFLYKFGL